MEHEREKFETWMKNREDGPWDLRPNQDIRPPGFGCEDPEEYIPNDSGANGYYLNWGVQLAWDAWLHRAEA